MTFAKVLLENTIYSLVLLFKIGELLFSGPSINNVTHLGGRGNPPKADVTP